MFPCKLRTILPVSAQVSPQDVGDHAPELAREDVDWQQPKSVGMVGEDVEDAARLLAVGPDDGVGQRGRDDREAADGEDACREAAWIEAAADVEQDGVGGHGQQDQNCRHKDHFEEYASQCEPLAVGHRRPRPQSADGSWQMAATERRDGAEAQ